MRTLGLAVLLALAVGAGCGSPATTTPAAVVPAGPVEISEVRFDGLEAAVKERKGKVVLVDFWATWCGPCVEKFPKHVERHAKYAEKGLVCMSVSLDPRRDDKYDKDKVLKFLKEKGAVFPNFVLLGREHDDEKIVKRFGLDGGIPFLALFGKSGERVWDSEQLRNGQRASDLEINALVEAELAK